MSDFVNWLGQPYTEQITNGILLCSFALVWLGGFFFSLGKRK